MPCPAVSRRRQSIKTGGRQKRSLGLLAYPPGQKHPILVTSQVDYAAGANFF